MFLHPDLDTFAILPWRPQQGKVARLICDVYDREGNLYAKSSRTILQKVISEAKAMGYEFEISPECEFFLFHTDEDGGATSVTHDKGGYLDLGPLDLGENARRDMVLTLEEMGIDVESSFHEVAAGQHELDFCPAAALRTADQLMTANLLSVRLQTSWSSRNLYAKTKNRSSRIGSSSFLLPVSGGKRCVCRQIR